MLEFINYIESKGIKLTTQQQRMVNHIDGPMLSLAVPGAGKTTSICIRVGNLIFNHGIPGNRIITMTFSKASAKDMENRFNSIFQDKIKETNIRPKFSTIHSFAFSIVRRHYPFKEMIEGGNSSESKAQILKEIYRKIKNEYISEDKYEELTTAISYIKNKMIDISNLKEENLTDICKIENFKEIFIQYETYKRQNSYVDYDDMLTISYEILSKNKEILAFYSNQFDYIQLDEAQDTSTIQFAIVDLISKTKNNVCFVADDDQSIYKWRGSEVSHLLNFKKHYPEGTIYFMEQNFRSTKDIIEIANEFIKSNKERYNKNMFTNKQKDRPITVVYVENEEDELKYIVEKIKGSKRYDDNAIIFRNNITSIPFIDILSNHNIPFFIREQDIHFFNHWVVQDILSFIKLSLEPNDFESFLRIYYKSNLYLNKEIVAMSKKFNDDCGVIDSILRVPTIQDYQRDNLKRFKSELGYIRSEKAKGEVISNILYSMEYDSYLENNSTKLGYSYENLSTITKTLQLITSECTIDQIIPKLTHIQDLLKTSHRNRYKNAVTLTTAHGSKGLEFNRVFVTSMVEDVFPSKQATIKELEGNNDLMEEERRLCYVAMTRGRHYVDLITLKQKNGRLAYPSKFIKEIEFIKGDSTIDNTIGFKMGDIVHHKTFGKGKVATINTTENIILILFKDSGMKKLSYNICLEKGLLKKGDI